MSKINTEINTVIFDIGNVLTDFCWADFIEQKGYTGEMHQRIARASVKSKEWNELDRGILSFEDVMELFIKNDPQIEKELKATYQNLKGIIRERDYAVEWIRSLREQGYRVYLLSNFPLKAHEECIEDMSFLNETDGNLLSYQEQVIKPEPEIYKRLITRFGLDPAKCLFIDDLESNLEGARKLGIHTICFREKEQVLNEMSSSFRIYLKGTA